MARGAIKNSVLLQEAAKMIAEYLESEVCDLMVDEYDGTTYCPPDCPKTVDDGCVLHLLRLKCMKKR